MGCLERAIETSVHRCVMLISEMLGMALRIGVSCMPFLNDVSLNVFYRPHMRTRDEIWPCLTKYSKELSQVGCVFAVISIRQNSSFLSTSKLSILDLL